MVSRNLITSDNSILFLLLLLFFLPAEAVYGAWGLVDG